MVRRILNAPKIFRNLSLLVNAENKINESDYDGALLILDKIKWSKVNPETKLMRARCLIGKGLNNRAVVVLQSANVDIENLAQESKKKNYMNMCCMLLIEEASGETIHRPTMKKLYDSIDFDRVPDRIKRQFPISVSNI